MYLCSIVKPSKIICDMSIINPYQIDRYVDTDRKVIRNGKQERIIDGYIDRDVIGIIYEYRDISKLAMISFFK